jgi:hypothetical protein
LKNAERDSALVLASAATVHERATWLCICRIDGASRESANPRISPGRVLTPRRPERFDEQDLDGSREHEITACSRFGRFLADETHDRREPCGAAQMAAFAQVATVTKESDVAEAVYRAATDSSGQLRFPARPDAVALAGRR